MDLNRKVLAAFEVEHREQLEGIRAVIDLARAGKPPGRAKIDEAFRLAHSMKGGARVCGLVEVETLGHRLESLFARVRDGSSPIDDAEVIAAIVEVLDATEDCMAAVAAGKAPPDTANAMAVIDRLLASRPPAADGATDDPAQALRRKLIRAFDIEHREYIAGLLRFCRSGSREEVAEAHRMAHSLSGAARAVGFGRVEILAGDVQKLIAKFQRGTIEWSEALAAALRDAAGAIAEEVAAAAQGLQSPTLAAAHAAVARMLNADKGAADGEPVSAVAADALPAPASDGDPASPSDSLRISTANLDALSRTTDQVLIETLRQENLAQQFDALRGTIGELTERWDRTRQKLASGLQYLSTSPRFAPLARFLSELDYHTRKLARHERSLRLQHDRTAYTLNALSDQLEENVRQVRLVSAGNVFMPFRKMVRDLARDEGKAIDFHVHGLDVEADRAVLQALKDPLMHMLRNAVTHGAEVPAERRASGKPPATTVTLRLHVTGNRLEVVVADDGRGIDPVAVAHAARRSGLEGENVDLDDEALTRMVFRAGLSTLHEVGHLAGRGMGLSVVHETVTRLQGNVQLHNRPGQGLSITITVPLSISTHHLLTVRVSGDTLAIPMPSIATLTRVIPNTVQTVQGQRVIRISDQTIPLYSLAKLIGTMETCEQDRHAPVVVVRTAERQFAVLVDELIDERRALVKDLRGPAARSRLCIGAVLLDDGTVAPVLNPVVLGQIAGGHPEAPAVAITHRPPAPAAARVHRVLVVDDSFTARTLQKSVLESHGYRVELAVDGADGLSRLRNIDIDLVIADVEMPRMDGFELLEIIKQDPRLKRLPVIMVTSRDDVKDQQRGMSLGAHAYIVKRKFDHQELITRIQQVL